MKTSLLFLAMSALSAAGIADPVKPVVPLKAAPFELRDVRLLDGPFKHAQELDRKYLHSLDPDRLLVVFRLNAGIPTTAKPYGGWEEPKSEVRGHFVGHYLSACAKMYAATGDQELRRRAVYMAGEMAKCQEKLGDGYLSAFPTEFIDRVEARRQVWAPYYTLHKILAGLLDVYTYCGDKQALAVARRFGDWCIARNSRLTEAQMQAMLGNEHGGMNEALANLFAVTGDPKYLAISRGFNHHVVMDPLAAGRDTLTGLHANTQIPKFIGNAVQYELTGDVKARDAAENFWSFVTKERSYVIGGHSDGEVFTPKERLSQALGTNTTETCNTYNMLKLTRHLFEWSPTSDYADYYERAVYNHILASQNPRTGMMCYYVPLRSGTPKAYNSPEDSFWCCTGTGVENHSQYGDSIYFRGGDSSLYVNLFIPSELSWRSKGVTVRQETRFPDEDRTSLTVTCRKPARFTLKVRKPFWAGAGFGVKVNGAPAGTSNRDGYVDVERAWRTGDRVEVVLPMWVRTEAFHDDPNRLAFLYGPIVLCAAVPAGGPIPMLLPRAKDLAAAARPTGANTISLELNPAEVRTDTRTATKPIELIPFFRSHDRPQMVYWDVLTEQAWQARLREKAAEAERRKDLAARTVDVVSPSDPANEAAHKLTGERHGSGPFNGRSWRHAPAGWFSYEMRVEPSVRNLLSVTYWGSDSGGRVFDILVDGQKIATERLQNDRPGEFFDKTYALASELVTGKSHVTIRFQAQGSAIAGGVFEVRILRGM